jgi:hypothetical protein
MSGLLPPGGDGAGIDRQVADQAQLVRTLGEVALTVEQEFVVKERVPGRHGTTMPPEQD